MVRPKEDPEDQPSFKPSFLSSGSIWVNGSMVVGIIALTYSIVTFKNGIEGRLDKIESKLGTGWTRNQMREYNSRLHWKNKGINFEGQNTDEIANQVQ